MSFTVNFCIYNASLAIFRPIFDSFLRVFSHFGTNFHLILYFFFCELWSICCAIFHCFEIFTRFSIVFNNFWSLFHIFYAFLSTFHKIFIEFQKFFSYFRLTLRYFWSIFCIFDRFWPIIFNTIFYDFKLFLSYFRLIFT